MNDSLSHHEITIVISSCDHFSDCWDVLSVSLKQFWPDCPFKRYLITNRQNSNSDQFQAFRTEDDRGWASNLKMVLERLNSEFILYLQEDYWLNRPVDTKAIEKHLNFCRTYGYDYLRLTFPEYDRGRSDADGYCVIPTGIRYRLCLQAALWRRSKLLEILVEGWSGWDFERKIESLLAAQNISVKAAVLHSSKWPKESIRYVDGTGVRKGRWTRNGAAYLADCGMDKLLKRRPKEGCILDFLTHVKTPGFHQTSRVLVRIMNQLKWNF